MPASKHSAGPWKVILGDPARREMSRIVKMTDEEFLIGYILRESVNKSQREEDDANASLTATAPSLLAVLEEILSAWESIPENAQVNEEMNDDRMWNDVRNVIAQAKGQA